MEKKYGNKKLPLHMCGGSLRFVNQREVKERE